MNNAALTGEQRQALNETAAPLEGAGNGADERAAFERTLSELVDKIVPGIDSGDLLSDARTASEMLDRALPAVSRGTRDALMAVAARYRGNHSNKIADEIEALLSRAPRTEVVGAVPNWRELSRRLYVELFHCDQQMCSTFDEDGEPYWFQGATVRDVLADAKAALESTPPAGTAAGWLRDGTPLDKSVVHRLAVQMRIISADAAAAPARYFVYDNECGYEVFDTDEERAKAHQAAIDGYLDDGWCGEVTSVVSGIVTHHTVKTDVETKPAPCVNHPDHDDEDCDACAAWNEWPNHEFDEICRYVPDPIPAQPATLALTDEEIDRIAAAQTDKCVTAYLTREHYRFFARAIERALLTQAPTERMSDTEDAERYRWLKMRSSIPGQQRIMLSTPWGQWDAAIDAARKAEIERGEGQS